MSTINVNDNIHTALAKFEITDFFTVNERKATPQESGDSIFSDINDFNKEMDAKLKELVDLIGTDFTIDMDDLFKSTMGLLDNVMSELGLSLEMRNFLLNIIEFICKGGKLKGFSPLQLLLMSLVIKGSFCEPKGFDIKMLSEAIIHSLGLGALYNDILFIDSLINSSPSETLETLNTREEIVAQELIVKEVVKDHQDIKDLLEVIDKDVDNLTLANNDIKAILLNEVDIENTIVANSIEEVTGLETFHLYRDHLQNQIDTNRNILTTLITSKNSNDLTKVFEDLKALQELLKSKITNLASLELRLEAVYVKHKEMVKEANLIASGVLYNALLLNDGSKDEIFYVNNLLSSIINNEVKNSFITNGYNIKNIILRLLREVYEVTPILEEEDMLITDIIKDDKFDVLDKDIPKDVIKEMIDNLSTLTGEVDSDIIDIIDSYGLGLPDKLCKSFIPLGFKTGTVVTKTTAEEFLLL